MILSMNHTGFVVKNLEESIKFYRDILGLKVTIRRERTGKPIDQVVGYTSTHIKAAMLTIDENHYVELIQYLNPEPNTQMPTDRNILGASHLAFMVDDIEKEFEKLISNGAQKLNEPVSLTLHRKACYLQDPDGNWVELIEDNE